MHKKHYLSMKPQSENTQITIKVLTKAELKQIITMNSIMNPSLLWHLEFLSTFHHHARDAKHFHALFFCYPPYRICMDIYVCVCMYIINQEFFQVFIQLMCMYIKDLAAWQVYYQRTNISIYMYIHILYRPHI